MVHLWPGSQDSYFAMVAEENARERRQADERKRAETDPSLQCAHGVSVYKICQPCCGASLHNGQPWHDGISVGVACGMCGWRNESGR